MASQDTKNTDFVHQWAKSFGTAPPLGHLLRVSAPNIWGRFHALPHGKRYATNDHEKAEIRGRANSIASALFDENASIWLVVPSFSNVTATMSVSGHDLRFSHSWKNPQDPEYRSHFYVREIQWKAAIHNSIFDDIAEDHMRATLFSAKHEAALSPYDGGFDVFSHNFAELRFQFADWLPESLSGL